MNTEPSRIKPETGDDGRTETAVRVALNLAVAARLVQQEELFAFVSWSAVEEPVLQYAHRRVLVPLDHPIAPHAVLGNDLHDEVRGADDSLRLNPFRARLRNEHDVRFSRRAG